MSPFGLSDGSSGMCAATPTDRGHGDARGALPLGSSVRVRFRAREEQRTPRVVHRQRVHLFEVAGRRHRPVEGAVELVDHLRRELLEVRLGVVDAGMSEKE